jgi:DMSO/TMAO reductase YedYZ molybdopterin-dependent catalytic subunit
LRLAGVQPLAKSVTFVSISGYRRRFGLDDATNFILATDVAGRPLAHGHGFPLRLVAPGFRGVNWIKWVEQLQVNETSKFWQLPLPLS